MRYCYLLILGWLLSACSLMAPMSEQLHMPDKVSVPENAVQSQSKGWWSVRFAIAWPESTDVDWSLDVYIADKIVQPVLAQYRNGIELWRFHRRAARDAAGHQFSFIFYSTASVAESIYQSIGQEKLLQEVHDEGVVKRVSYQDTSVNRLPKIRDTSDQSWSVPIQRTWPYFIMGVSEMWLRLIDELIKQNANNSDNSDIEDDLAFYQTISTKLDETWRDEGGHAFLHHLNALFGYQETIMTERRLVRF